MGLPLRVHFPSWLHNAEQSVLTALGGLKDLWKIWNLRSFILFSLGLQITLIFLAPFRKKTANFCVILSIWLAYLLADYVAIQAIGLIPDYTAKALPHTPHPDLLAFWSPFLLVHLGGPDPITALALEDNELWARTALHLFTYISATGRVFFQSLPANILSIPTILMFFAGFFKYAERIMSLYNARLTQFKTSMLTKPDPGPNYAKLMESYDSYLKSSLPAKFDTNPEPDQYNFAAFSAEESKINEFDFEEDNNIHDTSTPTTTNNNWEVNGRSLEWLKKFCFFWRPTVDKQNLTNVKLVRKAHEFFEKYKGLYVDLIFSFHDRNKSRTYFLEHTRTADEAFTVLEIELNFTYEVFFTKMIVIHKSYGAYMRRASFAIEVICLLIWILFIDKRLFERIDIWISYILLVGAIIIDLIAFAMVIVSDWQLAMLSKESETRAYLYDKLLSSRNRSWGDSWDRKKASRINWLRRLLFRRWSESIFKFNLITYCVDRPSGCRKIFFKLPVIKDFCEGFKYVTKTWFANELRNFIFNELRYKAEIAEDPKDAEEISDSKGDWVLRSLAGLDFEPSKFYKWTTDIEYDECLLLWHIATELLYEDLDDEKNDELEKKFRLYCKTLSDYMMYLLYRQPVMMFAVAGISDVRFRDTCAEAKIFFDRVLPKAKPKEKMEERHNLACKRMMEVNTKTSPRDIKGDRSKSVMFDAVRLAKKLRKLKGPKEDGSERLIGMWEVIAKVWVELLCYAATHCRASAHAAQLKQGGELLTLVWLLMMHFGLGKQFRITQGNARSKLIISK